MTGPVSAGQLDGPALSRPVVLRLLVVLAAASGCIDVFCVTRLGGFFASVITGNLVQLGHAVATTKTQLMAGGATAVGGYALGVAGGTLPLRRLGSGWGRRTAGVAVVQSVLLASVAAGWWGTGGRPGYAFGLALLGVASAASGVQSVITLSAGIRGAATTYLTGSLTEVVRGAVLDPHRITVGAGGISRLLGLFAGAVLGALTLTVAPRWAPALAAALVVAVVVVAVGLARRGVTTERGRHG
ncbi:YoaK family protein [Micromonospora sp. NPDC094482]|uniref:YoaK family protein n=1 Tax=unclassified Micromonospora TaxID=2617518 RepID=UPI003328B8BF